MTAPLDIGAVEAVIAAATPGPWRVYQCGDSDHDEACGIKHESFVSDREDAYQRGVVFDTNRDECNHMMSITNAAFIALARQALPECLAEIQRLRALVEEACEIAARNIEALQHLPSIEHDRILTIRNAAKGAP